MSKEYSTFSDSIPQLSFDIIARICPGLIILMSWLLVYLGPLNGIYIFIELIKNYNFLSFGFIILIIILSYMLSIFIFGMKQFITTKNTPIDNLSAKIDSSNNAIKFDILRVKFPIVGARLNKLRAETQGAQVLFYGLLIASIVNIYFLIINIGIERIIFEILLLLFALSSERFFQYISKIFNISLDNHYKICIESKLTVKSLKEVNIIWRVNYIINSASNREDKVVSDLGLVLFSTKTGDAWIIDPTNGLSLCLMKNGEKQDFNISESDSDINIEWNSKYTIVDDEFIIYSQTGQFNTILDYPINKIQKI